MFHVIVADAKTVHVFESGADDAGLRKLAAFHNPDAKAHERDLVTDRPGRTASSANKARQAYEPNVTARQHALQRWLKLIGGQLQRLLAARRSEGCVLIAGPRLLAQLRSSLPAKLSALNRVELQRDLATQPAAALERRVQPALRELRRRRALNRPGAAREGGARATTASL
ncbi:MAG TPA: host attachment protein [Steroidobacter sp.]|jgi:protein required for attachment to host cells|nr:host attachment protein [Steroidobacter sp.]